MSRNQGSRAPKIHNLCEKNDRSKTSAASDICNYDSYTQQEKTLAKFQEAQRKKEAHLIEVFVKKGLSILVPEGCDVRKRIAKCLGNIQDSQRKY